MGNLSKGIYKYPHSRTMLEQGFSRGYRDPLKKCSGRIAVSYALMQNDYGLNADNDKISDGETKKTYTQVSKRDPS